MSVAENAVKAVLAKAGIEAEGSAPWDITVHDPRFYSRVMRGGSLGLGETYMDGWWDCQRLDQFFERVCRAGLDVTHSRGLLFRFACALSEALLNLQSLRRARQAATRHYDLGNDMFLSWLDPHAQYSCAYFADCDTLERAQERKLHLICRKIGLSPGEKLLDVGCGWGGLVAFAARNYGCSATGVNISGSQIEKAREACAAQGLDAVVLDVDYREMRGLFDKAVSIGMFEHVGSKNHRAFMLSVRRCLKDAGIFLLHTIGSNVTARGCDAWIRKYIFPGGDVPSLAQIARAAEGVFVVEDVQNLGPHYDSTLMAWNRRFQEAWPRLAGSYPATFRRMWEYYLLSCAGAFRARALQLWQLVMTPEGAPQPPCRVS